MEYQLSKSEKKRRAKNIEQLAVELADLSSTEISRLPCDDFIRQEILAAGAMKGGTRKRQLKYLSKNLRKIDPDPLFAFMSEKKGSHLKQTKEFQELENLRDNIINEALDAARDAQTEGVELDKQWQSPNLDAALHEFPDLDHEAIRQAAYRFTRSRKIAQNREIFRILKAAAEKKRWADKQGE